MKVICTQENLKNGLQTVTRIINNSNTLPILNNVLVQTQNGLLKLSATNLEIAINTSIRCKIEEEGVLCIPAKIFSELVNSLPTQNITLEKINSDLHVKTDHYSSVIKGLSGDDFPLIPEVLQGSKLVVEAQELKSAFEQVVFAASTSETQPEISGIMLTG